MKEPAAERGGDPRDPDYMPPMAVAIPLGIQHVMAMFVPNLMPAVVLATAAGFGYGSSDSASMIYMIQMAMVFSGLSTLLQTIGLGPVGARLPVVQGTNFAFIPLMIPVVKSAGMAALFGGLVIGGLFHFLLGAVVGRIRYLLPPLITGIVLLMVSLLLIPIGIEYAAGGAPVKGTSEFGDLKNWSLALIVMTVTLALKFFVRGVLSAAAVLVGLAVGYVVGLAMGKVDFSNVSEAAWFMVPQPLHFGFEVNAAAVIGFCLMAVVSVIDTVGSVSGITKGGAGRQATVPELSGATYADGAGSTLAALFGGLPNTSYSQNVGLVLLTGVMSRHVVTIGAVFSRACGFGAQSRGGGGGYADLRPGRRHCSHVRHGWRGRCHDAVGRALEQPQHDYLCRIAVGRTGLEAGSGSASASAADSAGPAVVRRVAGCLPGDWAERIAPRE